MSFPWANHYEPKVPLMKTLFGERVAVANVMTVQMQTDAIEPPSTVSSPGEGNHGTPIDPNPPQPPASSPVPGDPAQTPDPRARPSVTPPACASGQTLVETASADVLFDFGKSTLNEAGKQALEAVLAQARQQNFESLTIAGFTDPLGSDAYNHQLSLDRATAVRDYLRAHGFPDKPITVQGRGSQDLKKTLADCPAGPGQISCLAPDRRVEFTFTKVKG